MWLGNVGIKEFVERTGYSFTEEEREWLESHRTDIAEVKYSDDAFHIFDMPFSVHCSETIFDELFGLLSREVPREILSVYKVKTPEQEREPQKEDPEKMWLVKWHMEVPVNGGVYRCFVNTEIKGYGNIPDTIHGNGWISLNERGFDGRFCTDEKELFVVGLGFSEGSARTFAKTRFSFDEVARLENGKPVREIHGV